MTVAAAGTAFKRIAPAALEDPAVTEGTGFGATPGLRYKRKIFAMLGDGGLVVKLPKQRVDELVTGGIARRFDPRRDGRTMKEWATIGEEHGRRWRALVAEALTYARNLAGR